MAHLYRHVGKYFSHAFPAIQDDSLEDEPPLLDSLPCFSVHLRILSRNEIPEDIFGDRNTSIPSPCEKNEMSATKMSACGGTWFCLRTTESSLLWMFGILRPCVSESCLRDCFPQTYSLQRSKCLRFGLRFPWNWNPQCTHLYRWTSLRFPFFFTEIFPHRGHFFCSSW